LTGARFVLARGQVRALTAAPNLDGWAIVERLLKDLAPPATWGCWHRPPT
jgi:hypothetical protein